MKKHTFTLSLVLADAVGAVAGGDEKDLMARISFSKQEIAKAKTSHPTMTPEDTESTAALLHPADQAEADARDAEENAKFLQASSEAKSTSDYVAFLRARAAQLASASKH